MRSFVALAAAIAPATATIYQGFNYASTLSDGSTPMQESDYQKMFQVAQQLVGAPGKFSSARLYTMTQAGTQGEVTSAIQAAINTGTTLLLGVWASGGQDTVTSEISALTSAMQQYGSKFTDLVAGISVGSEDLYRNSPTGIKNNSPVGAEPSDIVNYISQVRKTVAGSALASAPIGHVDTWTAWVNSSNSAVTQACDFIGMDAYPYFQTTEANSIQDGHQAFFAAYDQTQSAAGGKPVWITETGWPISGKTENLAVPSVQNAAKYWQEVGCQVFGNINTWWYTLDDSDPTTVTPSFSIVSSLSPQPLFNLQCSAKSSKPHTHMHNGPDAGTHTDPAKAKHHGHHKASPSSTSKTPSSKTPTFGANNSTPSSGSGQASPYPSSGSNGGNQGGNPLPAGTSGPASGVTSTGGAVAPTAKIAGLGMGVLAVGAALVL